MGHRSVTHMVKCKAAGRFDGVVKCLSVECAMKKTVFNVVGEKDLGYRSVACMVKCKAAGVDGVVKCLSVVGGKCNVFCVTLSVGRFGLPLSDMYDKM